MNLKEMGLKFLFESCETLKVVKHCTFLRDSGRELQTVCPKTEISFSNGPKSSEEHTAEKRQASAAS